MRKKELKTHLKYILVVLKADIWLSCRFNANPEKEENTHFNFIETLIKKIIMNKN